MTDRPGLSKGEMDVARVLWEQESATVREIHDALLAERRKVDFKTVQTYLRRLESKGYARTRLDGRTRVYSPRVRPTTVIRETVSELVDRLFGGQPMPLMRHLVEQGGISSDELVQLRELIDRLEQETRK